MTRTIHIRDTVRHEIDASMFWSRLLGRQDPSAQRVVTAADPASVAAAVPGLIFLATPYPAEAHLRLVWQATRSARLSVLAARELVRLHMAGATALCPVLQLAEMCHSAGLVEAAQIDPLDVTAWAEWSRPMLLASDALVVPDLQGWSRCPLIAVQAELAVKRGIPVFLYARRAAT